MLRDSAKFLPILLVAVGACGLAGCQSLGGDSTARAFGFVRDSPDEFAVTTQPPLSMPPDYTLRPPRPGAPRPQFVAEDRQAQEALAPQTALSAVGSNAASGHGEQALVAQAGPPAPPGIRQQINREAALEQPSKNFVDQLMFWRSSAPPGTVIDPVQEAQRLRTDSALGQSPEVGSTPIIQNKSKGLLEGLF